MSGRSGTGYAKSGANWLSFGSYSLQAPEILCGPRKSEVGSMIRVGILSFSDGRHRVHDSLAPYIREQEMRIRTALEGAGQVELRVADEVVWHPELARAQSAAIVAPAHAILEIVWHILTKGTTYHELGAVYLDRRDFVYAR
jgi:hypothetical protein